MTMTLNTYAEVDPDAKRAAVGKIGEAFDLDLDGVLAEGLEEPAFTLSFTVEQLEAMLAQAKQKEAAHAKGALEDVHALRKVARPCRL